MPDLKTWAGIPQSRYGLFRLILAAIALTGGSMPSHAELGLDQRAYGVWDREGGHSVSQYPYVRGQEYAAEWTAINPARNTFDWTALDSLLQLAYDQNQRFFVKIQPVSSTTMPPWLFTAGVPQIVCPSYTYGYYLSPEFKIYFQEMVQALGKHLREDLPVHLANNVSFVRVDTGTTGDEEPYENTDVSFVPAQYQISAEEWRNYRLWAFSVYDQAFQHGTARPIPLLFQNIEAPAYQTEQDWVMANVTSGFGAKYGGQVRGHHLSESRNVPDSFKAFSMDTPFRFFSVNEMDQTWQKPYFQLNLKLGMYWCAVEQLNAGMTIWDWSGSVMEGSAANDIGFSANFFNTWAAELDPRTARGGFCIFHEGLDSSDITKFPEATYGSPAKQSNTARYTAICAAYALEGAKMDDLIGATLGQVAQRRDQTGYNDSGWQIWPGNYDRFVTQINPDATSKGLWRVNGNLTTSSHPYDRFARRFDSASGRNTMYFDINNNLLNSPGQSVRFTVNYLDRGTGQFSLRYDATGNSQKPALTVTKANSNTWKTASVVVTDWVCGNNGPNGADLMLLNVDSDNDIFHSLEVTKLGFVTLNTAGQGSVNARNDGTSYHPLGGVIEQNLRLDLSAVPAQGWEFAGWSGDLTGSDPRPIIFVKENTQMTASFTYTGNFSTTDDFASGTWSGGSYWSDAWIPTGDATPGPVAQLRGGLSSASITRTLSTPIPGATLSFDWDLDRISTSESGVVEVYNGSSWTTVWTNNVQGLDEAGTAQLANASINLSAYGSISRVRFTINADAAGDRFWIDNVSITGGSPQYAPVFTANPISKASAVEDAAYSGQTLAGSATDQNGDPLTYSKISGPVWLSVAASGALSGTPGNSNVGPNNWTVGVSDGLGRSDTAVLNIAVTNVNDAPVFTVNPMSRANARAGSAYTGQTLSGSATDVDAGAVLSYSKVSGPAWLNIATTGALTGTPATPNFGANSWTVLVSDGLGASVNAVLNITVDAAAPQLTSTFVSIGAEDGYLLESTETSNVGGTVSANTTSTSAMRMGDESNKRQYKSVVSFDTSSLPDGATIISATLRLKRGTISSAPTNLGAIQVDIIGGSGFGGATALGTGDFQAAAGATGVATMSYPTSNGSISTGVLNATGLSLVNKTGKSQFRVQFATDDDNDNRADYLGFYSAANATAANRPRLVIVYQ